MAGLLDLLRRAAPGEAPQDVMAGSVMSPNYIPETSGRQLALGGVRGLLDWSPVGLIDAATTAINKANVPSLALTRAVFGRQQLPGDAAVGLLGQGGGAGYDAARMAAGAAVPMMGLLGNQAGGALPQGYARDQSGAIVWHGSPHRFDKFDSSKIGTGEGAQAYGHGLYFAENPAVAAGYQRKLSADLMLIDGKVTSDLPTTFAARKIQELGPEKAKAWFLSKAEQSQQMARLFPAAQKDADEFFGYAKLASDLAGKNIAAYHGQLYKVDLPDDAIARMLDWDKPLSQQGNLLKNAPQIKRMLSDVLEVRPYSGGWGNLESDPSAVRNLFTKGGDNLGLYSLSDASSMNVPGSVVVKALGKGNKESWRASEALRQAGIPGIRYLDGGSRNAGAGTSNYVVFPGNEGLLKILGRE